MKTAKKTPTPNRIARIIRPDKTVVTFHPGSDVTWIGEDGGSCQHGTVVSVSEAGAAVKPTGRNQTVLVAFYKLGVPEGETHDATARVELLTIHPPIKHKSTTPKISTKKIEKRFALIRQRLAERAQLIESDRQMHERDFVGAYEPTIVGGIDRALSTAVDAMHHFAMIDIATHSYPTQQADYNELADGLPDPVTLENSVKCLGMLTLKLCDVIGTLDAGLGAFHILERRDEAALAGRPATAHGDVFKIADEVIGEVNRLSDIANGKSAGVLQTA